MRTYVVVTFPFLLPLSSFSRKGPFLFPQTSPSSLPRSRGTGHRIFPWQSAMTVGVICIRRCMFHQFTLGKHANRGDRSIYIRIPFLVETQAGAECKRRQQLILGVRRYGNRKERLKEETKGGGGGKVWGKYEARLGNSEIIAPYSKYKGWEGGAVSTSVYTSYAKCFAPHSTPLHPPLPLPLSLHAQLFRVFPLDGMHEEYYRTPESTDKRSRVNGRRFSSGFYIYIYIYCASK